MRTVNELSRAELTTLVAALQHALYLDFDEKLRKVWNPNKDWDGADICEQLSAELARFDLVPLVVTPHPEPSALVILSPGGDCS